MSGNIPSIQVGNANLLLLAEILENADERHKANGEPLYNQRTWSHPCGTPSCAIGHWNAFKGRPYLHTGYVHLCARDFAMSNLSFEWARLFGFMEKCTPPKTSKESAARIREFVARRSVHAPALSPWPLEV